MCRVVGFWDLRYERGEYDFQDTLVKMRDTMSYGGPDDAGIFIDKSEGVALGHRRLSIIDLSERAHQPMRWQNLVITYNGEIYNFREIREELEKRGYKFFSDSDTEVILKAFWEWRFDCVRKFRGMWAFALWDAEEKRLILCRDRIGVKPLYWYLKDRLFMFASELKAFHKHPKFKKELDFKALTLYLKYGYIPAPFSIFRYAKKLRPGHLLVVEREGNGFKIREIAYWDAEREYERALERRKEIEKMSEDEVANELEKVLKEGFKLRLVADVPVGVFLSGGIDSTTVTALLQLEVSKPLKTFTIGFYEREYNEAVWAKKVAEYLGTEHHELYLTPREAFDIIPKLPEIYDEPFGDSSGIPTYLVSKFSRGYVKVALSADGGDEQFYGYDRYWKINEKVEMIRRLPSPLRKTLYYFVKSTNPNLIAFLYEKLKVIPFLPDLKNIRGKWIKLGDVLKTSDLVEQYDETLKHILTPEVTALGLSDSTRLSDAVGLKVVPDNFYDFVMLFDIKSYLVDDILVKVDRASMHVSLEAREPFLDNKILEFSFSLPPSFKWRDGKSKWILRKILLKYVPSNLIERSKHGFSVPIYEWFRNELRDFYLEYLSSSRIREGGIFRVEQVQKMLSDYLEGRELNPWKTWLIFVFEMWREKCFK